jgi:hypothetical protein
MRYPKLSEMQASREWLDVFRGYNHNLRISDGEFFEMDNLSSDNYPVLSPREQRGVYDAFSADGLIAKDGIVSTYGRYVKFSPGLPIGNYADLGLTIDKDTDGKTIPKMLISMGAYIIIMPDKKYINMQDRSDYGDIEQKFTTRSKVTFSPCKSDGTAYSPHNSSTAPDNPNSMDLWIDMSDPPYTLKEYHPEKGGWIEVDAYIKISATGIGNNLTSGNIISISGVRSDLLDSLNSDISTVQFSGLDHIVVRTAHTCTTDIAQDNPITITNRIPNMDFVIESGNRLWGCRYGEALNGEMVNEIYASKLGDFRTWTQYIGVSTDSYAASVGTDGHFTGAISYLGTPIFFKENCMHRVYGNYPANYQIQTTECRGVQSGSWRSLAIVNEVLYYKARTGICAYDGSLPQEVSSALGDVAYKNAVGGSLGNKYYVSMSDNTNKYHLFVFDTAKGLWHREDGTEAVAFCNHQGDLYYIDWATGSIKTIRGSGVKETKPIKWSATTGIMGTDSPDKKYVSRIDVRMKLDVGAIVTFFVEYDSSGEWVHLYTANGINLNSITAPIRPRRCDHLRLKIVGTGEAKIFSICKTIEWGSAK